MADFLYSIDTAVFFFINRTISNPVLDWLMPFLTDLNKQKATIVIVGVLWLWLMIRGGKTGRTAGILLVASIIVSDQFSSTVLKHLFTRIRPCHALQGVRLLVDCGSGYSFPSSHAVNNFAGATILSHYYRRYAWGWFSLASLVALSRPYIGVHYPSDIAGGALIGWACAVCLITGWDYIERKIIRRDPASPA
ncbi:MAG TPA: phosphatase PAP2 family protein [Bacteroidota bacterium]|nr:phosphatase PAP2 family protein [Bacteroidota bacterium]